MRLASLEVQLPPSLARVTLATALALGVPALEASCSRDPVSEGSAPATEAGTAVPGTEVPTTTIPQTPDTLAASEVISGPIGAQKDYAIKMAQEVHGTVAYRHEISDTTKRVNNARTEIGKLASGMVRDRANLYVDFRLAKSIAEDGVFYTYSESETTENDIPKHLKNTEGAVDLIADPAVKRSADAHLDLFEGNAAVRIATSKNFEDKSTADELLQAVEDPRIADLTKKAMAGDDEAASQILEEASDASGRIEGQVLTVFNDLYEGSGNRARAINAQIAAFQAAVARDGQ